MNLEDKRYSEIQSDDQAAPEEEMVGLISGKIRNSQDEKNIYISRDNLKAAVTARYMQ